MFRKYDEIRSKMNEMGRTAPFLFILDFELEKPVMFYLDEIDKDQLLYNFDGIKNYPEEEEVKPNHSFHRAPISYEKYRSAFDIVMQNLEYGNSYLCNLTMATAVSTDISLRNIFFKNRQKFRLWMNRNFVVFSPEIFVTVKDGYIHSHPMKGTIDAKVPDALHRIMSNKKEEAEHATIVDLIRNDLSMVASEVTVTKYRYVDEINTWTHDLLQISSEITGKLPSDWKDNVGDILLPMLPAGSVSGAPKRQTVEIIRKAELGPRGYYTGVMGIFTGEELVSSVMIRFIEDNEGKMYYRSGGGITHMSNCEDEYNEMLAKVYLPL
ncbi:aminodeoxychorismate synthase component I [Saccharicrinis sp. FJH2]|uniref:aminodeoxychorismate synthase component I n=1 Tax=Saccharicrinis sp. FJH65 TaxID=3344659 RepID=UPI0035F4507D